MAKKVDGMVESTDAQASVPGSAAEALKKHEAAKMSRRAVLSKVGLNFGAAALLALSVDDLARKVTATIAANNRDNEVAQAVAQEFKNAGIAFADADDSSLSELCYGCRQKCAESLETICEGCPSECPQGSKRSKPRCPGTKACDGSCWGSGLGSDSSGDKKEVACDKICKAKCPTDLANCKNDCEAYGV